VEKANRNKAEFKVFGLRRSGIHAAMYWIARHYPEPVWFSNDVCSFDDPTAYREEEEPSIYEPDEYIGSYGMDDFWTRDKDVLLWCCEEKPLKDLDWEANREAVGGSDEYWSVLVIRDPFNLIASRGMKGMLSNDDTRVIWKQHAREALGETSFLKNKVVVNYNRWFSQPDYRRELEKQMGLGVSDEGINKVYGLGSSFTNCSRDGEAGSMKVFDRWKHYKDNEEYLSIFDSEIIRMAWALFGSVPECFARSLL